MYCLFDLNSKSFITSSNNKIAIYQHIESANHYKARFQNYDKDSETNLIVVAIKDYSEIKNKIDESIKIMDSLIEEIKNIL